MRRRILRLSRFPVFLLFVVALPGIIVLADYGLSPIAQIIKENRKLIPEITGVTAVSRELNCKIIVLLSL